MIPQEYIQEVVRRNDIEEVIGQYVQLRRRGRTLSGLCPFHNEKTPSFVVYPDTQSFYCFGCGAAGDVINFVRKYNNLGYVESVKQLASRVGMPLPEEEDKEARARQRLLEINRCAARYFYEQLNAKTPEAAQARRYWKEKTRPFGCCHPPVRSRLCAGRFRRVAPLSQAPRVQRRRAGTFRPDQTQRQGKSLRYFPPSCDGAHHRCARFHHRFRRPCAG